MVVMNAISSLDIVRADDIDIWNPTPKVLAALQRSQGEFSHLSPDSLEKMVKESEMFVEKNMIAVPIERKAGEDAVYSRMTNGKKKREREREKRAPSSGLLEKLIYEFYRFWCRYQSQKD